MDCKAYKVDYPEAARGKWKIVKFEIPKFSIENLRMMRDGRGAEPGIGG